MADYWLQAWTLSDFSGALAANTTGTQGFSIVGTSTVLDGSATQTPVQVTDDDAQFEDMYLETGNITTLTQPLTLDGTTYPAGSGIEAEYYLTTDDVPSITLVVARIGDGTSNSGENLLVFTTGGELVPGQTYTFTSAGDDAQITYSTICFAGGTLIDTDIGPRLVEDLMPGDLVMTLDRGLQPLAWVGRREFSAADLMFNPHLKPVRVQRGSLAPDMPSADLVVSPQHRIFVTDWRAELYFGQRDCLVAAHALVNDTNILRDHSGAGVTYHHLMFDRHEIVQANGLWAESLHPSDEALKSVTSDQRAELLEIFPELAYTTTAFDTARMVLRPRDATVLRHSGSQNRAVL